MRTWRSPMSAALQGAFVVIPEIPLCDISYIIKNLSFARAAHRHAAKPQVFRSYAPRNHRDRRDAGRGMFLSCTVLWRELDAAQNRHSSHISAASAAHAHAEHARAKLRAIIGALHRRIAAIAGAALLITGFPALQLP